MQRLVIDTNYLADEGLQNYLAASRHNYGLINQITMVEVHKEYAATNARRLMQIACRFPGQIIILRDLVDLTNMDGTTARLSRRMIDADQTAKFGAYCETIIHAPLDTAIERQFAFFEEQSRNYLAEVAQTAPRLFNLFRMAERAFDASDVRHLCKRQSYPANLQKKLVHLAFAIREVLISAQQDRFPKEAGLAINTYLFRYSLVVAMFFARWVKTGRNDISNPNRLLNQIFDMKITAMATFFDGLLTREPDMAEMYEEASFVSAALGGYTNCGLRHRHQRREAPASLDLFAPRTPVGMPADEQAVGVRGGKRSDAVAGAPAQARGRSGPDAEETPA